MSDLNILTIDQKIRANFERELEELPVHRAKLADLELTAKSPNLSNRLKRQLQKAQENLTSYVADIEGRFRYDFYIASSVSFIEEYKQMLKTPVKVSFLGKPTKKSKKKVKLVEQYLAIASQHMDIDTSAQEEAPVTCDNCSNKKDFDVVNRNTYICTKCYGQQTVMRHNSSYNDIDRVNISSKYMYDRKVHFRDCIKQYQGKQNSTIPPVVYERLEEQFQRHHLLEGDKDTAKEARFAELTKNHILMFLKELGYSNHYENVHLIHYTFTAVRPDDIGYLEDQLLDDFDVLTDLYDREFKNIARKNFINTQYVLYQLLRRHKHPCKKEEFIILKTIDRKLFHDDICKQLFATLSWNFHPFY